MRQAWIRWYYISERPALTAETANSNFKMIQFEKRFEVGEEDASIAIGMRKDDNRTEQANNQADYQWPSQADGWDDSRNSLLIHSETTNESFFSQVAKILAETDHSHAELVWPAHFDNRTTVRA